MSYKDKRILVTGGSGFVGKHLLRELMTQSPAALMVTKLPAEHLTDAELCGAQAVDLDILSEQETRKCIQDFMPDFLFHLAAQSSVGLSFQKPELTMQINVLGFLHVLEALREYNPSCRLLLIGSSEQYGIIPSSRMPINEDIPVSPVSPYAVSKMAAEALAHTYQKSYTLQPVMVRAFNHIGPGQAAGFVVSDFARQIALIESGKQEPVMRVGNLSAERDFTDVRDIVRAYRILMLQGRIGEAYNIGSGKSYPIQYILDTLLSFSKKPVRVEMDPDRMRPAEVPYIRADTAKIYQDTGWKPEISVETSLQDALSYWRLNV